MSLQEENLREAMKEKVPVTLFLMNGFQIRGIITGFDDDVLVVVTDGKQQKIYKHGIPAVAPIGLLKAAAS